MTIPKLRTMTIPRLRTMTPTLRTMTPMLRTMTPRLRMRTLRRLRTRTPRLRTRMKKLNSGCVDHDIVMDIFHPDPRDPKKEIKAEWYWERLSKSEAIVLTRLANL